MKLYVKSSTVGQKDVWARGKLRPYIGKDVWIKYYEQPHSGTDGHEAGDKYYKLISLDSDNVLKYLRLDDWELKHSLKAVDKASKYPDYEDFVKFSWRFRNYEKLSDPIETFTTDELRELQGEDERKYIEYLRNKGEDPREYYIKYYGKRRAKELESLF
jgi:hypothetical protein